MRAYLREALKQQTAIYEQQQIQFEKQMKIQKAIDETKQKADNLRSIINWQRIESEQQTNNGWIQHSANIRVRKLE